MSDWTGDAFAWGSSMQDGGDWYPYDDTFFGDFLLATLFPQVLLPEARVTVEHALDATLTLERPFAVEHGVERGFSVMLEYTHA